MLTSLCNTISPQKWGVELQLCIANKNMMKKNKKKMAVFHNTCAIEAQANGASSTLLNTEYRGFPPNSYSTCPLMTLNGLGGRESFRY